MQATEAPPAAGMTKELAFITMAELPADDLAEMVPDVLSRHFDRIAFGRVYVGLALVILSARSWTKPLAEVLLTIDDLRRFAHNSASSMIVDGKATVEALKTLTEEIEDVHIAIPDPVAHLANYRNDKAQAENVINFRRRFFEMLSALPTALQEKHIPDEFIHALYLRDLPHRRILATIAVCENTSGTCLPSTANDLIRVLDRNVKHWRESSCWYPRERIRMLYEQIAHTCEQQQR